MQINIFYSRDYEGHADSVSCSAASWRLYWRPPRVCCAAEGSARGECCLRKGCAEECSVVVMSSFVGGVAGWELVL
jgi:hypothetical protein